MCICLLNNDGNNNKKINFNLYCGCTWPCINRVEVHYNNIISNMVVMKLQIFLFFLYIIMLGYNVYISLHTLL